MGDYGFEGAGEFAGSDFPPEYLTPVSMRETKLTSNIENAYSYSAKLLELIELYEKIIKIEDELLIIKPELANFTRRSMAVALLNDLKTEM